VEAPYRYDRNKANQIVIMKRSKIITLEINLWWMVTISMKFIMDSDEFEESRHRLGRVILKSPMTGTTNAKLVANSDGFSISRRKWRRTFQFSSQTVTSYRKLVAIGDGFLETCHYWSRVKLLTY